MKAPAKINFLLRVLSLRPDGRHDIESVMQALDLFDEVEVETQAISGTRPEISCKTEGADLPEDENNLAYRAARAFLEKYQISLSVKIRIRKHIPLAAGLAGGSADAAAVLLALAAKHAPGATLAELAALGVTLGADIPFQIYACAKANSLPAYAAAAFAAAIAGGIGEQLIPVHPAKKAAVLLVNPGISVSAAEAYRLFDLRAAGRQNETPDGETGGTGADALSAALAAGQETAILSGLSNDLLPPVAAAHPEVKDLMAKMTRLCARHSGRAMMSGSGPTVYGVFFSDTDAQGAYAAAQETFPRMFLALSHTL
jgi:4-diphosphocytidyl-2-C-methyl-D-erythritol kinase